MDMLHDAIVNELRRELGIWEKLTDENYDKAAIEASRRKVLGLCRELDQRDPITAGNPLGKAD